MKTLVAIISGALVASLPLIVLVVIGIANRNDCLRSEHETETPIALEAARSSVATEEVPSPCEGGYIFERLESRAEWISKLMFAALSCVLGGMVTAKLGDTHRVLSGSFAAALPYSALSIVQYGDGSLVLVAAAAALGSLGTLPWRRIQHQM